MSAANSFGSGPVSNVASATPSGALPAPANAAAFVSQGVPATMSAGRSYPVTVTMRNTGTSVWTAAGGYRLGSQSPPDNGTWGLGRVEVPGPVQPGATAAFRFTVTSPTSPGNYDFQWRMVQEGVQWFGDLTPQVSVSVGPPAFQIVNVNNGDTKTGDLTIVVNVNDTTIQDGDLHLLVDGVAYSPGYIDTSSTPYTTTFVIGTEDFTNGVHTISVINGSGTTDSRSVTFSNQFQQVDVDGIFDSASSDPSVPTACHVGATETNPQPWQVLIQDMDGNTVRTFNGSTSTINVAWDGTNNQGVQVSPDPYDVVITLQGLAQPSGTFLPQSQQGGQTTRRETGKSQIGDACVIIDKSVVIGTGANGQPNWANYLHYIHKQLDKHGPPNGSDFIHTPNYIVEDFQSVRGTKVMAERAAEIQNIFKTSLLSFLYVHAHGTDLSGVIQHPDPSFALGEYRWYSYRPLETGIITSKDYFVDEDTASLDYGFNFASPVIWMDHCCSFGSDGKGGFPQYPLGPYNSFWSVAFNIDFTQGALIGWGGNVPGYGSGESVARGNLYDGPSFDAFRQALWSQLFTRNAYLNDAFTAANTAANLSTNQGISAPIRSVFLGFYDTIFSGY